MPVIPALIKWRQGSEVHGHPQLHTEQGQPELREISTHLGEKELCGGLNELYGYSHLGF